jgi:hypothetical protein
MEVCLALHHNASNYIVTGSHTKFSQLSILGYDRVLHYRQLQRRGFSFGWLKRGFPMHPEKKAWKRKAWKDPRRGFFWQGEARASRPWMSLFFELSIF